MNPKKDRPASLTPSLLARKGEAAPSRLADGSAPRDVMALHEEIVARLASEIGQEGAAREGDGEDAADDVAQEQAARARIEPSFDFETSPQAVMAPQIVSDDDPYEDDTHFDYEDAEDAGLPAAPQGAASLQDSDIEDDEEDEDDVAVVAGPARIEPHVASRAASAMAVPAPFVTLRPSDAAGAERVRAAVSADRVVASLPAAFAVMVAIAIGGGVGLWFADGMNRRAAQPDVPVEVAENGTVDAHEAVAPLPVPATGDVAVAPIETPAAPRPATPVPAAPVVAAKKIPVPVPAPAHEAAPKAAAPSAALNGAFGIQLLASPLEQDALAAWDRIFAKHSAILGTLPHEVVRADLGAKGVFYRLRVGSFASRAEAKAVCAKLSAARQDCMVVAR